MVRDGNGRTYDITAIAPDVDGAFPAGGGIARTREAPAARLGNPCPRPGDIVEPAIGGNDAPIGRRRQCLGKA